MTTAYSPSHSFSRRDASEPAFTLTELLVVIAIITLLAVTAVPALGRAKPKSQIARCSTNMRIWGMATAMYLGDNGDHLPYYGYSAANFTEPYWNGLLAPYVAKVSEPGTAFPVQPGLYPDISTNEVSKCPGGSYSAPPFYTGGWASGAWNCWIGVNFGIYATSLNGPFYYATLGTTLYPPLSVARIKKPADAMIYTDTITRYVYSPVNWKFAQDIDGDGKLDTRTGTTIPFNGGRPAVHNGGANVTLMDGHVERVSFDKLWKVDAAANVVHSFWYMED
jgi:prepilin-type processing-associated H-X9-DG protein/prepilin-type N-terminal cleavage/methylation domain-containing protein